MSLADAREADLRVLATGPRRARQWPAAAGGPQDAARSCGVAQRPLLPEVSELDVVRHYTRLSQLNFSIDTHFYPLGSCTMKYNPKACNAAALLPEFLGRHPLASVSHGQGFLACMYELQEMLKAVTGMRAVALSPLAGAHGEFAGVAMIRAYHRARGDTRAMRSSCRRPRTAPIRRPPACAAASRARWPWDRRRCRSGRAARGRRAATAGIMLTNPSTLGVFERRIEEVARIVHEAADCSTTTAPISTPFSARCGRATWASTSSI
jgi:glycine dehydrogenase subunit 2